MAAIEAASLVGRWVHSREEDTAGQSVYRSADYAFPPARGRDAFELQADGTSIDAPIAPGDGNLSARGRWELQGDLLHLYSAGAKTPSRTVRILSAGAGRVVIATR